MAYLRYTNEEQLFNVICYTSAIYLFKTYRRKIIFLSKFMQPILTVVNKTDTKFISLVDFEMYKKSLTYNFIFEKNKIAFNIARFSKKKNCFWVSAFYKQLLVVSCLIFSVTFYKYKVKSFIQNRNLFLVFVFY